MRGPLGRSDLDVWPCGRRPLHRRAAVPDAAQPRRPGARGQGAVRFALLLGPEREQGHRQQGAIRDVQDQTRLPRRPEAGGVGGDAGADADADDEAEAAAAAEALAAALDVVVAVSVTSAVAVAVNKAAVVPQM